MGKMKAFICAALLGVTAALPAGVVVAAPAGYAAGDLSEPPVYAYNYGVADDYSGAAFSQTEQRDGYATSGSYTVNLPDGRVQTVTYSDNGDGIVHAAPVAVAHAPVVHAAPVLAHAVRPVAVAHAA